MSVAIITASSGSNLELAKSFQEKFVEYNVESTIVDLAAIDLPIYSTQVEDKISNPLNQGLLDLLSSSTKYVFVAPEYNGATPPSFQNFLDIFHTLYFFLIVSIFPNNYYELNILYSHIF